MNVQSLEELAVALESARVSGVTSAVLVTLRDGRPHAVICGLTPVELMRHCRTVVQAEVAALIDGGEN